MDEELASLPEDLDADFREALRWWMRLRECPVPRSTFVGFERWLTANAAHQWAFARVEALWETVRGASSVRAANFLTQAAPEAGNSKPSIR